MAYTPAERQAHHLIRLGLLFFLVSLLIGLAIPQFALPRLGLSAHLVGLLQSGFVIAIAVIWPRLVLSPGLRATTFALFVYGCVVPWVAILLGAIWGAGGPSLPMAAGAARGTALQEAVVTISLRSGGLALIVSTILMLIGVRLDGPRAAG